MDLKVTYFEDILPLTSVKVISTSPKTIAIRGKDFNTCKKVLINGQPSPYYVAHNSKYITAQCPNEDKVTDVIVLSSKFTSTDRSLINMTIGDRPEMVSGIMRLMQRFMRILLRDPGSDKFNPSLGGGLNSMIVKYFNAKQSVVTQEVAMAVTRASRQLTQLQVNETDLSPSEKLASATLLSLYYSDTEGSLSAVISLISQSGVTGKMNVGI